MSFYVLLIEPNNALVEEMTCKPDLLSDAVGMIKDSLSLVIRSNWSAEIQSADLSDPSDFDNTPR